MQRNKITYLLDPAKAGDIKQRILNWSKQFSILCFLDSNSYPSAYQGYECLVAAGARSIITTEEGDGLLLLQRIHNVRKDWIFGHINYDFKNVLELKLRSAHPPTTGFPTFHFFIPQTVCYINRECTQFTIESFEDPADVYAAICGSEHHTISKPIPTLQFSAVISKENYLATVAALRSHIAKGDCYEINFCNEGYCANADIDPLQVFNALNTLSPAPYAAYYRLEHLYMMCASPERYLRKDGNQLRSQPIKGTARRDRDEAADIQIKIALHTSIKERAENVMIVDLVRNDLARCCNTGSVAVDELFGIYSFPQVHQMISTVSGTLRAGMQFTDAIRHTFPMGSMTGAPKHKVMQLIEKYEQSRRELFSGTIGYITPAGDFDFNVIIRSLFYNAESRYLSYQTGGAITFDSNEEQEWEEMRLKAWAMERIFSGNVS